MTLVLLRWCVYSGYSAEHRTQSATTIEECATYDLFYHQVVQNCDAIIVRLSPGGYDENCVPEYEQLYALCFYELME